MKKAPLAFLSLALVVSMTACGQQDTMTDIPKDDSPPVSTQEVETPSPDVPDVTEDTGPTDNTPLVSTQEEKPPFPDVPDVTENTTPVENTPQDDPVLNMTDEEGDAYTEQLLADIEAKANGQEQVEPEVKTGFDWTDGYLYATADVNIRDTYSTDGNKLGVVPKGKQVYMVGQGYGEAEGWIKILSPITSEIVYVKAEYFSVDKPVIQEPQVDNTPDTSSGNSNSSGTKDEWVVLKDGVPVWSYEAMKDPESPVYKPQLDPNNPLYNPKTNPDSPEYDPKWDLRQPPDNEQGWMWTGLEDRGWVIVDTYVPGYGNITID